MCTSCRSLPPSDQELPSAKRVSYGVDLKRVFKTKLVLGIADGWLAVIGFSSHTGRPPACCSNVPSPQAFTVTAWHECDREELSRHPWTPREMMRFNAAMNKNHRP
jgi:hypothetical protein